MGKLQISTTYESKLVRRNWVFRLFILGILGYTLVSVSNPVGPSSTGVAEYSIRILYPDKRGLFFEFTPIFSCDILGL